MVAMASCKPTSTTQLPYFQDISTVRQGEFAATPYLPPIAADDELFITVMSESPEASAIYNLPITNPAHRGALTATTSPRQQTYTVNAQGDITLPVVGTIHVAGLNVEQVAEMLTKRISKDIEDPMVKVEMLNFTVNVGGEVKQPGRIPVNRNRFTLLDAIVAAGDLTEYGERSNVLVVREVDGKKEFARIDLNKSDIFTSPYYYLRPNDYVYVEPNKVKSSIAQYDTNNAYKLSVISTIVSAASVIASLVIALTVK